MPVNAGQFQWLVGVNLNDDPVTALIMPLIMSYRKQLLYADGVETA